MSANDPAPTRSLFAGVSVLLVEDETMISFLIEDMLRDAGCTTVWHASSVSEALAVLQAHRPDVAVLDVNLAGELVFPVAERLDAACIPFVFSTGYGRTGIPPRWARIPTIQKPFRFIELRVALASVLAV